MNTQKLDITESSDFYCLLELMVPLYNIQEYAWLPELFSIIGHENLIRLAKYAGGESIKIPTIEQLTESLEALNWYYRVYITRKKRRKSIPDDLIELVDKIKEVYDAQLNPRSNK